MSGRFLIGCYHTQMSEHAALDWSAIDTVLLDMDGTLLDQRFDNWFWQELIPRRYAAANGISEAEARALLAPKFRAVMGTIRWYCIDYWSRELGLTSPPSSATALEHVGYLPGAQDFLSQAQIERQAAGARHQRPSRDSRDQERTGPAHGLFRRVLFDSCRSRRPRKTPTFGRGSTLQEPFVPQRTLFVDDSLRGARCGAAVSASRGCGRYGCPIRAARRRIPAAMRRSIGVADLM